jgi:agmatinase
MKLTYFPSADGFLGVQEKNLNPPERAKAVVIPFGFEASVSYGGGTALGPQAMIEASHQVELFDEELWCEPYKKFGVATLKAPALKKKVADALDQLEDMVESVLAVKKFPFTFGGEHSITAGAIRPFAKRHKKLTILHFDAHADLRDGYDGEHYSHAAALRRCLDHPNVNLVSVGIRNISQSEIPFYEKNKNRIKIFWAKDMAKWKVGEIIKALGNNPVYLTFDIDGFDASMIPATGTPEPGGFDWWTAMSIIKAAAQKCDIVGADIVELAPKPNLHACDFLAAKLAYKILGYKYLLG